MLNETETAKSALEAAASNPKVAASIAAGTTALGAAVQQDLVMGWLAKASLVVGLATGLVVLGIQLIIFERAWRERRAGRAP